MTDSALPDSGASAGYANKETPQLVAGALAELQTSPDKFTMEEVKFQLKEAARVMVPRQVKFVDEYVTNGFVGSKAYEAAEYTVSKPEYAYIESSKLLTNSKVVEYLRWKLTEMYVRADVDVDYARMVQEINSVAYSALTDVVTWNSDGEITLKPSAEIPREVAVAVKKIKTTQTVRRSKDGGETVTTVHEIEMHDKGRLLALLAGLSGRLKAGTGKALDKGQAFHLHLNFGGAVPPQQQEKVIEGQSEKVD